MLYICVCMFRCANVLYICVCVCSGVCMCCTFACVYVQVCVCLVHLRVYVDVYLCWEGREGCCVLTRALVHSVMRVFGSVIVRIWPYPCPPPPQPTSALVNHISPSTSHHSGTSKLRWILAYYFFSSPRKQAESLSGWYKYLHFWKLCISKSILYIIHK